MTEPKTTEEREAELDDLNKDLEAPYIHAPDEKAIGDGTLCFLDKERVCDADCTAFNWELPPGQRQAPNQCMILYHLGAVSSGSIAYVMSTRRTNQRIDDTAREAANKQKVPTL